MLLTRTKEVNIAIISYTFVQDSKCHVKIAYTTQFTNSEACSNLMLHIVGI